MRRGRFCVVCGRATEELVESMCRECFPKEKELVALPEKIEIKLCRNCLSYFRKGRWVVLGVGLSEVLEKGALDAVMGALKVEDIANSKTEIKVEDIKESSRTVRIISCSASISGKIAGGEYHSRHKTNVFARFELCDECSRKSGGYYEGILQIRGETPRTPEGRGLLKNKIEGMLSALAEKDRRAFVTEFHEKKEGLDFYLGSTKAARKIAHELQKEFGGIVSESPKLVGREKSGKDLYRISIALRLPDFNRGDVIQLRRRMFEVLGFSKDKLAVLDMATNMQIFLPQKNLKEAKVIGRKEDIPQES